MFTSIEMQSCVLTVHCAGAGSCPVVSKNRLANYIVVNRQKLLINGSTC